MASDDFGLTLNLHMAALVAVDAHTRGEHPPTQPHELSGYLLDREYQAWQRLFDAGRHGQDYQTWPTVMAKAVFTAVLTGALSHTTATHALRKLDLPEHPQHILDDHRFCYPPTDPSQVLEPLYPDRLAEDFLALLTPGHTISAYDPDPWTHTVPATLTNDDGLRTVIAPHAVTFLAAATSRWPHVGQKVLYPLLRADARLAITAGSAALTTLATILTLTLDLLQVLEVIELHLTDARHINLDVGAAAITQRLVTSPAPATPHTGPSCIRSLDLGWPTPATEPARSRPPSAPWTCTGSWWGSTATPTCPAWRRRCTTSPSGWARPGSGPRR